MSYDYRTVRKVPEKTCEAEKTMGLNCEPAKCETVFLGNITDKRRLTILASSQNICPGIKTPTKEVLIILRSSIGPKMQADLFEKKNCELGKLIGLAENFAPPWLFMLIQSFKNVVLLENQCMFY